MTAAAAVEAGKNHDTVDRKLSDTQVAVLEVQSNVINILQEQESKRRIDPQESKVQVFDKIYR